MARHFSVTFDRLRDILLEQPPPPLAIPGAAPRRSPPRPGREPAIESPARLCFLDNVRAFVILCVMMLHTSMIYMENPPAWWYVVSPRHSLALNFLGLLLDTPVMMVMFFIAAYFLLPSLVKRDPGTFLKDKFIRIGAPWIAGVVFLAPPTVYLACYSRHLPVGFFRFVAADFWCGMYQQSVYWFLGILFLFFMLFSVLFYSTPRFWSRPRRITPSAWKILGAFWVVTTLAQLAMARFHVPGGWCAPGYVFYFQPWRVPLYVGYFALGVLAYRKGWFTAEGYRPRLAPWSLLWALSGALYVGIRAGGNRMTFFKTLHLTGHSQEVFLVENAILFSTFCLCSLLAGAAFFQRYVNGSGRFWKNLAANSYGIYYIHPLILYPLALCFINGPLPVYLQAAAVLCAAAALSWAVSALVLRKTPVLRRAF